ncbi:MAG: hypothetical protein SFV24_17875 [Gemmatimonadales bacterium]|nr:hypothetical protein [Gemmatimonadales bacterium]
MTSSPRRRFHDIRCAASRLGDWMNHLEDKARSQGLFDGAFIPDDPKYHIEGRGERLLGIYHALIIIAERAECRINPEALEAFRLEVEAAEATLAEDWAKELLAGDAFEPVPLV